MQTANLMGLHEEDDADWDWEQVSKQIDELRGRTVRRRTSGHATWTPRATLAVTLPPTRPLTFDVLLHIVGSTDHWVSIPTLNAVRQTCRAAYRLVEKPLILAHNYHTFYDHRRLARVCYLILRRPLELLPLIHTLSIDNLRPEHGAGIPCLCAKLLAKFISESGALTTISLQDAENVLEADSGVGLALASSSSLRELHVRDGVGLTLMATFRQMGAACGLRKLDINLYSHPGGELDVEPLLPALMGLRATLEELVISASDDPLAIDIDEDDGMVWPAVHTIRFTNVWAETPELVKAFPNLRHLDQGDDHIGEIDEIRERSHDVAMCWPDLDTVALGSEFLWAAGLACSVRRLSCGFIVSQKDVHMLLEDLLILKPVVLDISLDMPPAPGLSNTSSRDVTAVAAALIWLNLPRTKTLYVRIRGWATSLTIEAIDEYLHIFATSLHAPKLEFLKLRLEMHHPLDLDTESDDSINEIMSSAGDLPQTLDIPLRVPSSGAGDNPSHASLLKQHLAFRMSDDQQQELLSVVAVASPSLRYVCIQPWAEHAFQEGDCYWEVLRMNAGNEGSANIPAFCRLSQKDGARMWKQWEDTAE